MRTASYQTILYTAILTAGLLVGSSFPDAPAAADPLLRPDKGQDVEALQAVHKAEHEVDRAWEVFHRAALGGTLASPAIQTDVEQALHESRGLLVKARDAADRGDRTSLQPILDRIHELTERAIQESQEQKR